MNVSPCLNCHRVADPKNCENKNCQVWRRWFINRWEAIRSGFRSQMECPTEKVGVPISGNTYAAPHQVRRYLKNDPCHSCLCAKDLCKAPCPLKKNWQKAREEVLL